MAIVSPTLWCSGPSMSRASSRRISKRSAKKMVCYGHKLSFHLGLVQYDERLESSLTQNRDNMVPSGDRVANRLQRQPKGPSQARVVFTKALRPLVSRCE